jgi:hypothetical protein
MILINANFRHPWIQEVRVVPDSTISRTMTQYTKVVERAAKQSNGRGKIDGIRFMDGGTWQKRI